MKKCWANNLGDCSGKLTNEHLVSHSILGKSVKVRGFSWCKDAPKEIGSACLTNKILCEKHNRELSIFDHEAKNFVSVINSFNNNTERFKKFGFRRRDLPIVHKINGKNLERWCCKTLINTTLSQNEDISVAFDKVSSIIYKDEDFMEPYGLNFAISVGQKINTEDFLEISPLFNITENLIRELAGGLVKFQGFYLIILIPCSKQNIIIDKKLLLNLKDERKEEWINLQLNWHNRNIDYLQSGKNLLMQRIKFDWD